MLDARGDWKGIAELLAALRVIMLDVGATPEDVVEMEKETLATWGVDAASPLGRAIIAWEYLHPEKRYEELTN